MDDIPQPSELWDSELQNLLRDERARCDQHKQMYQTLKETHGRLQDELAIAQQQLKEERKQREEDQSANSLHIQRMQKALHDKHNEVVTLTEKLSTVTSKEHVEKAFDEATKTYKVQIEKLEADVNKSREQYNQLHYDYTVIKCQLDYIGNDSATAQELAKVRHEAEINELKEKIEILENERKAPVKDFSVELRAAEKEVMQVNSRLKMVLAECEELRAQNERLTLEMDGISQTSLKQHTNHLSNIQALESEKSTMLMQKEVLTTELANQKSHKQVLTSQLQDIKQETLHLSNLLEQQKNKYEIDTGNLKLETQQYKIELESEKERQKEDVSRLKTEIRNLKSKLDEAKQTLMAKEQSFHRQLHEIKQQSWKKCSELEYDKQNVELMLKEAEKIKNEECASIQRQLEVTSVDLKRAVQAKLESDKEIVELKALLQENSRVREKEIFKDIEHKNEEFRKEVELLKDQLHQLLLRGRESAVLTRPFETDKTESGMGELKQKFLQEELHLRLTLEQQKHEYQQRIDGLESQLREHQNSWQSEKREMQNKTKQYARLITKLREKFSSQTARLEEIEVQNSVLSKNVPLDDYMEVKNALADLRRKHEEFQQVMVAALPFGTGLNGGLCSTLGMRSEEFKPGPLSSVSNINIPNEMERVGILKSQDTSQIKVTEELNPKLTQSLSERKLAQRRRSKSRRVADYSSSSDIENL